MAKPKNNRDPQAALTKSQATREQILGAAARLFRRRGYAASTLRDIAAEAQVEAGSIYYHFDSKDAILDEVLDRGVRDIYLGVKAALSDCEEAGADFRTRFAAAVAAHLTYLLTLSDFTSTNIRNYSQLPEAVRRRHLPLRRQYGALWDGLLKQAQAEGAIRPNLRIVPLRQFVLGALNWTVEWFDPERSSVKMLGERATKLILDGMATKPEVADTGGMPYRLPEKVALEDDGLRPKGDRTREEILRAAARLIRDRGYAAATLRDIASEAAMEAGSIYYHFRSKEKILDEVLDRGLRDIRDGVRAVICEKGSDRDYRATIAAAIRTHLTFLLARGEFTSANIRSYGQLPEHIRERHRPIRRDYSSLWDRLLTEAQAAGALRRDIKVVQLRQVLLGALNWTVEWLDPAKADRDGFANLDQFADMCVQLLLDGIALPPPEESHIKLSA
ncbi:MAG TPA: TetR family transcriptional regulator [Ferrovibrio sp.]|jgi:AcrR family transcriptional regulator|uniref:TetR/AcrR family transcriptional regulator n=1 Tax=Ferrovibrio sp. TaxID=1917215 RepID=UPI002ED1FB80